MIPYAASRYAQDQATVQFDADAEEYVFINTEVEPSVAYRLNLKDGRLQQGNLSITVRVEDRFLLIPVHQGGFYVRNAQGQILSPSDAASPQTGTLVNHRLENSRVIFDYEDVIDGETLKKQFVFYLRGNTLVLELSDLTPQTTEAKYVGFTFEASRYLRNGKLLDLPGAPFPVAQCMENMYLSTYVDPFYSNASRYQITRQERDIRFIHASNTPAWTQLDDQARLVHPLRITAYLTVSPDILDVLPVNQTPTVDQPSTFVLDLGEWPLTHPEATPYAMIRRWEAPANGAITLRGEFTLTHGEMAVCEVTLIEGHAPQPRTLFTQMLDPIDKPVTAIEGVFPVQQGDQLLFTQRGPGILSGGEMEWSVRIDLNRERYDSRADFTSTQGEYGWYYEEKRDGVRTPLVWNGANERWESLTTRGYQNADRLVSRSGAKEDAYRIASDFINDLLHLGLSDAELILRGWLNHAAQSPETENAWGTIDNLFEIVESLQKSGNRVYHDIDPDSIMRVAMETHLAAQMSLLRGGEERSDDPPMDRLFEQLTQLVTRAIEAPGDGAVITLPSLDHISSLGFQENMLRFGGDGSQATLRRLQEWTASLRTPNKRLYAQLEGEDAPAYAAFAERMMDGVLSPMVSKGGFGILVNPSIRARRPEMRIGIGDYRLHDYNPRNSGPVDSRFFPLDDYFSTTVMYRRTPHISDRFWHPNMTIADIRRILVQAISLLHPVSKEYLAPGVRPAEMRYYTGVQANHSFNGLLAEDKIDDAKRLLIRYDNGLHIFVNRDNEPWNPADSGLVMDRIDSGGFLAVNAQTGLLSLIGERFQRRFAVGMGKDEFYLHSKDGRLFEFGPYATDGLCRLARSTWENRWNIIVVDALELIDTADMTPLLRCNRRFSARHWWTSPQRIELAIVDIEKDDTLLEIFTLPQSVFVSGQPQIEVTRIRAGRETFEPVEWRSVRVGNKQGIRIGNVQPGDRYSIAAQLFVDYGVESEE